VATDAAPPAAGAFTVQPANSSRTYAFYTVATDRAGNAEATSAAQASTSYSSDMTAPSSQALAPATSATRTFDVPYAAADDANGIGLAKVDLYARAPGASSYTLAGTDDAPAANGAIAYTGGANGTYSFYTVATDRAGNLEAAPAAPDSTTALTRDTRRPTSKGNAPVASAQDTWIVTYTASDTGGAGLGAVELWARPPGQSAYTLAGTDTAPDASGSISFMAGAGVGAYAFYTIAVDREGNREVAPTAADGTTTYDVTSPSTFQMTAPAAYLRGTVTLRVSPAPTDSGSGLASVTYQYAPSGTTDWEDACVSTRSAWSCAFNTTLVPDGAYDLRAIATDKAGNPPTVASNVPFTRPLDNTAPVTLDVATTNAAGRPAGLPSQGDTLTYTFSEPLKTTTVMTGWNGASARMQARFIDDPAGDRLELWNAAATRLAALGNPFSLGGDYVPAGGAVFGSSTATGAAASTMIVTGTTIVVTLGAPSSGGVMAAPVTGGTLTLTPQATVTDLAGNPLSTAALLRRGPAF
jgi:hypothetical protein